MYLLGSQNQSIKACILTSMTESSYRELQELLENEREILLELFLNNFTNLLNLHVNVHLPQHAQNFATLVNTAVGVKEMVHRTFKNMVPHTNRKAIELDLTRRYNTIQALRHLLDGWVDPQFNTRSNTMNKLAMDPNLCTIFSGWYATENPSVFMSNEDVQNKRDVCHDKNFIDISFGSKWDNRKVESIGLSKNLDVNHPFFQDLCKTYADYLNSNTTLINKKLAFYNSITYTVLESNQDLVWVKLRVGDFGELLEETEDIAYAKIESIF
ncbi:hypothetical protein F8M41_023010 [Gigaspora margarita]|uniref:Uncharacterized protein n=1 Tax=Gigaspora margarita TaxID=4874 RepID=A0A8H4EHT2_GIGMA|nr:hypothetical protein F8M41_023010 [Gigaspora margarita]